MAPIIGITFSKNIENDPNNNYIRAIEEHGGIPLTLYPGISEDAYTNIDGLLLTGGPDIDPSYFGEEAHETTEIKYARDALELFIFKRIIKKKSSRLWNLPWDSGNERCNGRQPLPRYPLAVYRLFDA